MLSKKSIPVMLCVAGLAACGGSSSPSKSNSVALAGNWQLALTKVVLGTPSTVRNQSGFFLQHGATLSGGLLISGNCAGLGQAQGQVGKSNVSITTVQSAQTITLTGTASADGSNMNGTYSLLASGCGTSEVGNWTANQVKPLNGNFQAIFTSSLSGLIFNFSGSATQGANTGASTASLSGNMTSSDATCFTTAVLSGLISGTSVVFNVQASDGTSLGKISGTASADMSTITGNYGFSNPQSKLLAGCGGHDSGTVSFTVQ